jgi:hypothetical protein
MPGRYASAPPLEFPLALNLGHLEGPAERDDLQNIELFSSRTREPIPT